MAIDLDAVAGRKDNTLTPISIVRQFFERFLKGVCGKMETLPPFNRCCFVV
jgi:hypothetical protein